MTNTLRAGLARRIISPPKGIFLIGYGKRFGGNRGVRDDLTATALTFDDGERHVTLVTLDLLAINEHTVKKVQRQSHSNLMLCCAHTHSAPVTYADKKSSRKNRRYLEFLVAQIVEAIKESEENLQVAQLAWAKGESHIAVNRRERKADGTIEIGINPTGGVDSSLALLQIQNAEGEAIANLVNLACHNTAFGPENQLVSADWAGEMRKRVEAETGVPCLYLQGATGDLNPKRAIGDDDESTVTKLGAEVAQDIFAALGELKPLGGDKIRFRAAELWLPLEAAATTPEPPPAHKTVLAKEIGLPKFAVDPLLNYLYPWKTTLRALNGVWATPVPLSVLQIGEFSVAGLGMEVFHEIGLAVKESAPSPYAMFSGVCNGCTGYLPSEKEYRLGGYEVDIVPYFYRLPGRLASNSAALTVQAFRRQFSA
jgi:hypothetical protein